MPLSMGGNLTMNEGAERRLYKSYSTIQSVRVLSIDKVHAKGMHNSYIVSTSMRVLSLWNQAFKFWKKEKKTPIVPM